MEKEQKCHFDGTPNEVNSWTGCADKILSWKKKQQQQQSKQNKTNKQKIPDCVVWHSDSPQLHCNSWFCISFCELSVLGYCSTGE